MEYKNTLRLRCRADILHSFLKLLFGNQCDECLLLKTLHRFFLSLSLFFFLVVFPISVVFILVLQLPHWQSENNDDSGCNDDNADEK